MSLIMFGIAIFFIGCVVGIVLSALAQISSVESRKEELGNEFYINGGSNGKRE